MNALAETTNLDITETICSLGCTASNFKTAADGTGKFIFFEADIPDSCSNEEILEILVQINEQLRAIDPSLSCIMTVK